MERKGRKTRAPETTSEYIDRVQREIVLLQSFGSQELDLNRMLDLFWAWARISDEKKRHTLTAAQEKTLKDLGRDIQHIQARDLPKMRDAYGPLAREVLWEHDLTARTFGRAFTVIEFVGATFASNRNIQEFHTESSPFLLQLRFKQVRYKWIKLVSEYTQYTLKGTDDRDLVIWSDDDSGGYRTLSYPRGF